MLTFILDIVFDDDDVQGMLVLLEIVESLCLLNGLCYIYIMKIMLVRNYVRGIIFSMFTMNLN